MYTVIWATRLVRSTLCSIQVLIIVATPRTPTCLFIFSTSISGAIYTLNIESTAGADASVETLKLLDLDLNVIGAKMIDHDHC